MLEAAFLGISTLEGALVFAIVAIVLVVVIVYLGRFLIGLLK